MSRRGHGRHHRGDEDGGLDHRAAGRSGAAHRDQPGAAGGGRRPAARAHRRRLNARGASAMTRIVARPLAGPAARGAQGRRHPAVRRAGPGGTGRFAAGHRRAGRRPGAGSVGGHRRARPGTGVPRRVVGGVRGARPDGAHRPAGERRHLERGDRSRAHRRWPRMSPPCSR